MELRTSNVVVVVDSKYMKMKAIYLSSEGTNKLNSKPIIMMFVVVGLEYCVYVYVKIVTFVILFIYLANNLTYTL